MFRKMPITSNPDISVTCQLEHMKSINIRKRMTRLALFRQGNENNISFNKATLTTKFLITTPKLILDQVNQNKR